MDRPMPHLISVDIRVNDCGWFVATSVDCPGLFIAYPERRTVEDAIGDAIEVLYLAKYQTDVKAIRLSRPSEPQVPGQNALSFAAIESGTIPARQTA
jgi:hypothetical protein